MGKKAIQVPKRALPLLLAAWVGLCAPVSTQGEGPPPSGRVLRVHLAEEVVTLDWGRSVHQVNLPLVFNLQEGLTTLDRALKPVPALAKSWSYDATGTQLKIRLREDATWSDGRQVTAHDFVDAFKRLLTPAEGFTTSYFLFPIRGAEDYLAGKIPDFSNVGVKALSPTELELTFKAPSWRWIRNTCVPSLFPIRSDLIESSTNWNGPGGVTTGPFQLISHIVGREFSLKRRSGIRWPSTNITDLRFRILEYAEALKEFTAGQLDVIFRLPPGLRAQVRRIPSAQIVENSPSGTRRLDVNRSRYPMTDPHIRRALAMSINRAELLKRIDAPHIAASSFVPMNVLGYRKDGGLPFDPRKAREEFDFLPKGIEKTQIDLLVPGFDDAKEENEKVALELKRQWETALRVEVRLLIGRTVAQYRVLRDGGDYHLLLRDFNIDSGDPLNFYAAYASDSRLGVKWPDRKFDVLLDEANRTRDDLRLAGEIRKLDDFLLKDSIVVIPLFYVRSLTVLRSTIQGYDGANFFPEFLKGVSFAK